MDQNFLKGIIEKIAEEVVKKLRQPYQTSLSEKPRTPKEDAEYRWQRELERRSCGESSSGHK